MASSLPPGAIPNGLTISRILLCPVLLVLALLQRPQWFLLLFALALLTDFLDGFLARILKQKTDLGARLDSIADASLWIVVTPAVCMLWPTLVQREAGWILAAVFAFAVPGILGLIRYHQVSGYHTWSAKLSMAAMGISLLLLLMGFSPWPFRVAILIVIWACVEETLMTVWLPAPRHDLPTAWHAWAYRKK